MSRVLLIGGSEQGRQAIERRAAADFEGKVWATRKRPWVDRLATAWLVSRRIDPGARFAWQPGQTMVLGGALPGEPACTLVLARESGH